MQVVEMLMEEGLSFEEAMEKARDMKQRLQDGESPEKIFLPHGIDVDTGILSLLCAIGLCQV